MLQEEFVEHPTERDAALVDLREAMSFLEGAQEPDDLLR
jgi:hypothetical protein